MARVTYHPEFTEQFEQLCADPDNLDVAGDISALITGLETYGHDIEGEAAEDASHPIVMSSLAMFALRRTPPTDFAPTADGPPIIRVPYVWFQDQATGEQVAVVMLIGDKTDLGNHWYPVTAQHIENTLVPQWIQANPSHKVIRRRSR